MSRTPEEQKTLDAIAAGQAAGEDVFGDEEELVRDEPADAGAADPTTTTDTPADGGDGKTVEDADDSAKAKPGATDGTKTEVLDEAALQEIADPLGIEAPTRFNAEPPKDYKAQRDALLAEKAKAMKRLMDGEIDTDEFTVLETGIADKLEDLTAQRIRAETLQEANIQNDAAYQQREIKKLIRDTKAEVDYTADPKAAKQFDQALAMIQADPDNAGRDYAELIGEAHRTVAALRGVQVKAPATPAAATATNTADVPNRNSAAEVPVTLRNLPAAATPNAGGGVVEQMGRLHGPEYEAAWSKLTPQQRAVMLDEA